MNLTIAAKIKNNKIDKQNCAVAEKRERCPNFSSKEEQILLSLVEQNLAVVENKKTDAAMWNQKRRVWNKICADFEVHSGHTRNLKNLRDKYENLKKKTRKELAEGGSNISSTTERLAMFMQITAAATMKNEFDGGDNTENDYQKSSSPSDHSEHKELLNFLDVDIKSENIVVGEEELVEQVVVPESTDHENLPDQTMCRDDQDNELSNFSSWASWKPAAELKKNHTNKGEKRQKPSGARRKVKKGQHDAFKCTEKSRLLAAQRKFFENEDKRSDEKHRWERNQSEMQLKILEVELEIKKEELKRKQLE